MLSDPALPLNLEVRPLTPKRWLDLGKLFGPSGACGGCWCMWPRLPRAQFERQQGEENRQALKAIVDSGEVPGLLAYADGQPIAWCSASPREAYVRLERSRILKPVDDEPVWSVVCLFVAKPFPRKGVTARLLEAAVAYAGERGARIVEGYPVEPKAGRVPDAFGWHGLASAFRRAGSVEVARRSETRPVMRRFV